MRYPAFLELLLCLHYTLIQQVIQHLSLFGMVSVSPRFCTVLGMTETNRLGDSYASPGMTDFMKMIQDIHPDIFIHSVHIEEDLEADQKAGWVRETHWIYQHGADYPQCSSVTWAFRSQSWPSS